MKNKRNFGIRTLGLVACFAVLAGVCFAVTSKITYHKTAAELSKGKTKDLLISSKGIIQLGSKWEKLGEDFNDVWSINCIVKSGNSIYLGTSPNGGVYEYSNGNFVEIYSAITAEAKKEVNDVNEAIDLSGLKEAEVITPDDANEPNEVEKPVKAEPVKAKSRIANEHIFTMATDIDGRVLVGMSGKRCALATIHDGKLTDVYEPNDANYIFAIAVAKSGDIFLGTGPSGKIYKLDPTATQSELFYDSTDKNILSLAITDDGSVLAGTDTRGLIYKIDAKTKKAVVLYDTEQDEVTSIMVDKNSDIYAAATSAMVVEAQKKFAKITPPGAGRPEKNGKNGKGKATGKSLKIANTKNKANNNGPKRSAPRPPKPKEASHVYKVNSKGFVTDVLTEVAVFFSLVQQDDMLLLGTGNNAELYKVDPATEQSTVIYKDEQASQITAVLVSNDDVYLGTSNPAKLIRISKAFASKGTYTSDLIDAGQPCKWGKLQLDADIPNGCAVTLETRSGNVQDVNDETFSGWSKAVEVTGAVQVTSPQGRFCQYRLTLSSDGDKTPIIREIALASVVPNLAPIVQEVSVGPDKKPGKQGIFNIGCKAKDDNGDTLSFKIDFRKVGREKWIEIENDLDKPMYEWDTRTVEDGRYEIRIIASDEKSNSTETKLSGSRVSDQVVVDNTGPVIKPGDVNIEGDKATIKLTADDVYTAIEKLEYTVDSNSKWKAAVPDDLVYDTINEKFTIVVEELEEGEHIVAVKARDHLGNTTYKTIELTVE